MAPNFDSVSSKQQNVQNYSAKQTYQHYQQTLTAATNKRWGDDYSCFKTSMRNSDFLSSNFAALSFDTKTNKNFQIIQKH